MAELLEEIKKLSREEQLELAEQIYALGAEKDTAESEEFLAELRRRTANAIRNPQSGISWPEAKARLLDKQREQEEKR